MKRYVHDYVFKSYAARLVLRALVFLAALYTYLFHRELIDEVLHYHIYGDILGIYVVWALLMMGMLYSLIPYSDNTMGSRKQHREIYVSPEGGYDKSELYAYVQRSNASAMWVLLVWLCINGAVAMAYLLGIIGDAEIVLVAMLYYVCDLICVVIWCPFQSFIMKNRCCVNCRIFNWGWFMICTPFVLIRSFMSWSLFFMSLVVVIRWEIAFANHPERFWSGSNSNLQCVNCGDKICKIKKPLVR